MKKILIIDDDLLNIATLSQILLRNGYQVCHATDEERAFRTTKKEIPDLIICNYESSKLDVFEMVKNLRQVPKAHSVPFLFITESPKVADDEPRILGPKRYLTKPFTREQLTIAVQENINPLPTKRK